MNANERYGSCGAGCGCGATFATLTPSSLMAQSLKELGYATEIVDETVVNVADRIDNRTYKIVIVSNPSLTELIITCQVDSLKNAGDTAEEQRDYLFNAIDINDNIAPFATSIITPQDASDPLVVLVSKAETDQAMIVETLRWQLLQLRRAIVHFNSHVLNMTAA